MCGRYTISASPDEVRKGFEYEETPNFPPRYNIAPTQPVPVVRPGDDGRRHFALVRWGLVPGWAKEVDSHGPLINARAESVTRKPSFRGAMAHRRCLFIADGFYEWQKRDRGPKQPWFIRKRGGGVFAFAGLWEAWMSKDGSELESAALITVPASAPLAAIHHRMPAILLPAHYDDWLDTGQVPADRAAALLQPVSPDFLEFWPVSTRVNRVVNDDPGLIEPGSGKDEPRDLFD